MIVGALSLAVPKAANAAGAPGNIDQWLSQNQFYWSDEDEAFHIDVYDTVADTDPDECYGWYLFAGASRTYDFFGQTVKLDADLDFTNWDWNRHSREGRTQLTVGNGDLPFKGTFDGQSHTISNLKNEREGLLVVADCGLFGQTKDAVIKNLNLSDCYVGSSFRGGLVAGYAQDTLLLNILCENCTTSVIPANNVVNLITNAGLAGGMIAGETNGSTLYNCEMRAGSVVCNATAGLAALGGQPLYLGGLVGAAQDTVIEYSRVTDIMGENGDRTYAEVWNQYENAASVASYSEVFTGGIVGMMQAEDSGSKIVDCYSTADCYSKAAIYFGVGLGLGVTRGYTGGIVGMVRDVGEAEYNLIERVSYAGNLHSYNYNVVLLGIPAIETDRYMGGIVGRGCENATVTDAYFMRSASSTSTEILALREGLTYSSGYANGANFGPRDRQYVERDFWEGEGFDFAGGTLRNYGYEFTSAAAGSDWSNDHYNKWVMDYNRGIPVHGGSIKATLDAPGAGSVTIGRTGLASDDEDVQTTTDPYDFAVQGYLANDETIELTYTRTTDAPADSSWADDTTNNKGYRFMGWYRQRGVQRNDIPEQHSLFTKTNTVLNATDAAVISEGNRVGNELTDDGLDGPYTLAVNKPNTENLGSGEYADNDLYVAYVQMQVLLHDVNGNVLNKDGSTTNAADTSDDWYDYEGTFVLPSTCNNGSSQSVSDTATLIGWTTVKNTAEGSGGGYPTISSTDLNNLKSANAFWEVGATFTVTEPANLYPVYADLISNVSVIYEGHEQDNNDSKDQRESYGRAVVKSNNEGIYIAVVPFENSPLIEGTVRFLGWYENIASEGESENWVRVSTGEPVEGDMSANNEYCKYYLNDVDLTQTHVYKARFEYRVDYTYYVISQEDSTTSGWDYFAQVWEQYKNQFNSLTGPSYRNYPFSHWAKVESKPASDALIQCEETDAFSGTIVEPVVVAAHNSHSGSDKYDHLIVTTDFPTGPAVEIYWYGLADAWIGSKIAESNLNNSDEDIDEDYWFHGWTFDSSDTGTSALDRYKTSTDRQFEIGLANAYLGYQHDYWDEAHVTAKVEFHGVGDASSVVKRRYEQPVFLEAGDAETNEYVYPYHYSHNVGKSQTTGAKVASTSAASPSDESMAREGLIFLGWVDKSDPAVTGAEWSYALGAETVEGAGDAYLVDDIARVEPYLMSGEETCTRPMDLYPVYAKFSIETTTNIKEAGVEDGYNVPKDPSIADASTDESLPTVSVDYNADGGTLVEGAKSPVDLHYDENGTAQIKLTVDKDVFLKGVSGDKYTFVSLTVSEDGVVSTVTPEKDGTFDYTVQAGKEYVFTANYEPVPVTVTYHLKEGTGVDATDVFSVGVGEPLPMTSKTPSFEEEEGFFVGWTEGEATGEPVVWSEDVELVSTKDIVQHSMHLWPVYRKANVTVDSNIDAVIRNASGDPGKYRYTTQAGDALMLTAKDYPGYEFTGWYKDYVSGDNTGTQLTSSKTYALTGDERFSGETYTAVYQPVYEVRYHTVDGSVIYTAKVAADSDRKFLQTVKIEDPDKPNEQTEVQIPVDLEAFTVIASDLSDRGSDENADSVETFVTWQWVTTDANGTTKTEEWNAKDANNFVNRKVTESAGESHVMDLYPVTDCLKAFDSTGQNYTSKLTWSTGSTDEGEDAATAPINVVFTEAYDQPWLKVTANRVAYAPNNDGNTVGVEEAQDGRPVYGYRSAYDVAPVAQGMTGKAGSNASAMPETSGVAYLEFPDNVLSTGALQITKTTDDASAVGKTFYFEVVSTGAAEGDKVSVTVPVTVSADSGGGTTTYSGTAVITLPYGSYRITEDTEWAWRYKASPSSADVTVTFTGYDDDSGTTVKPVGVSISNTLTNGSWIDGEDYKHNVFGSSSSASGGE